jgi:hypothetical protein
MGNDLQTVAFFCLGRPLLLEDGFVIYSYQYPWALPEQSLTDSSPAELGIISFLLPHLRLDSLSVASYHSQGYRGGQSQSHFATDGRSVSMSGAHDQMFVNSLKVTVLSY